MQELQSPDSFQFMVTHACTVCYRKGITWIAIITEQIFFKNQFWQGELIHTIPYHSKYSGRLKFKVLLAKNFDFYSAGDLTTKDCLAALQILLGNVLLVDIVRHQPGLLLLLVLIIITDQTLIIIIIYDATIDVRVLVGKYFWRF